MVVNISINLQKKKKGGGMKIFIAIEGPLRMSLERVLTTLLNQNLCLLTNSASGADLIIVSDNQTLHELYSDNKRFAFVSASMKQDRQFPKSVRWFEPTTVIAKLLSYIGEIAEETKRDTDDNRDAEVDVLEMEKEHSPRERNDGLHILVIDDKEENLRAALELLGKDHFVSLADGYGVGKRLIEENDYDVVLADCQMPADIKGSALSINAVKLGELVHNGIFLMFPATRKGMRFAIVTNANHHMDWVSAIFDDLHEPQMVNGVPVLFINYLGKRWDEALKKLMNIP